MKILDASWTQLREFVAADDRPGTELLLDEILRVELARQVRQQVDRELHRRAHDAAEPWIPRRIRVF